MKRTARLPFVNDLPASDKRFITNLALELHLEIAWDEYDEQDQNLIVLRLPASLAESEDEGEQGAEWEDEDDEESKAAIDRVLRKYNQSNVLDDDGFDDRYETALQQKMDEWKDRYYKEKLEFVSGDSKGEEVRDLVFRYCEGLQWVMYYYYSGVASWGWFYNYHYAPRISGSQLQAIPNPPSGSQCCRSARRRRFQVQSRAWQAVPSVRAAHGCAARG